MGLQRGLKQLGNVGGAAARMGSSRAPTARERVAAGRAVEAQIHDLAPAGSWKDSRDANNSGIFVSITSQRMSLLIGKPVTGHG